DSFRTVFVAGTPGPLQSLPTGAGPSLQETDLSDVPPAPRAEEPHRCCHAEAARVFDLTARPPVHFELVRFGPEDHTLLVNMHHIISDGWSIRVMLRELSQLYNGRLR